MFFTIIIVLASLVGIVVLHELGHFLLAKKFDVKVEEFGVGIPPRIFKKKIGETVYSLNLLPLGAFVKLYGEEERVDNPRSFSQKPIWQRVLIVLGGVVTFWAISAIIFSIIAGIWGIPFAISDEENHNLVDPKVQITMVAQDSPAAEAGLEIGDIIRKVQVQHDQIETDKVKEIVDFTQAHTGEKVILKIERRKEMLDISLIPRIDPPEEEGPMGIALTRVVRKNYRWYQAPIQGIVVTKNQTLSIVFTFADVISKVIRGVPLPKGSLEVKGIVGIGQIMAQTLERGPRDYLWLIAMISIFLALFNILPIPALDGGKLLFLGIEKNRGRPVSQKIEQNITVFFFFLLIILMIFITIKDIKTFF